MTNTAATGLSKIVGIGAQILVNGGICVLLLLHLRRLRRFAFSLQWAVFIAAFAVCSTLWSQDALTTLRRSIPFALATLFALYFASRFQTGQQLSILVSTMAVLALVTICLALFVPSIGMEASRGHFGNWQGVFTQKNACGRAMVFSSAALLSIGRVNVRRLVYFLLFSFVLVMSGSRAAWMIEGGLLFGYGLLRLLERFQPWSRALALLVAAFVVATSAIAAWMYFPVLTDLLGRDATLSGRTAIWQQVWAAILKHPMLGYGFAAFWQGMKGESYNVILALRFVVFHAHNGFLQIWLELGAVGLLLFLLSYLRAWRKLWPILQSESMRSSFWMIFVLLLVGVYDLDENTLLTFNGLFWVLYVSVLANLEILAREHMERRRFALGPAKLAACLRTP
ncbi:O-antigen ligase family protein [Alloacidobacterium dinghuense]|uniref:O-antigen ligase family protein n=1 Tax=Alloacidobacterium dinghuense TaxID=2763107 RepID=A0A7G8BJH9_9BACT|nr:O-antigen ligase [Alloacidobacterium dinghuense]QNI32699.1 O-antigen ligase family protein [Alloacidobacterium dinghuense]